MNSKKDKNTIAPGTTIFKERWVMLVDDDPAILKLLSQILTPIKIKTKCFTDPFKALEFFKKKPAPVVLTDLGMPGMNGVELLEKMKEFSPASKVVITTGYIDDKQKEKAFNLGVTAFMEKPIKMAVLRAMVLSLLVIPDDVPGR